MAGCDPGLKARTEANPDRLSPFQGQASFSSSLFQRRIEFHPARKQHDGFAARSGDFKIETLNPSGGSSSDQSNKLGQHSNPGRTLGKKVDGFELLENWLDPELSLGVSVQRIGAGLQNLGNTCFLNSVLQCLTYTEPLAAYLQSGRHQNSCRINGFCALCAIQKHISRALNSTGRILAPKDLVLNLRCISRNFRNARQEDAHEYMVNLLESMHKCCLPSGVPSESPSAYEKSLVHKIFGGRLRSQVKCTQCSYCSDTFDPFLDLSLEIAKADSLVKALKHFTASEQLDGGERQYQCQRCKQKVRALKQLTVHKAPYVLTIHLKRFHSHDPGRKIDKRVQFDPTIDLKPFVSGSYEGDLKYTLYGVLVHRGWSTHSGHYFCYVRTSTNMWYSLDDNQVCQVSESTVLQQNAYMLFYVRNRSHIQPRKVIGTPHKEGIKENAGAAGATGATLISNQIPRAPVKTDHIKNSTSVVVSPASFISRDTLSVGSSSKITMKEPPVQTTLGREGAESPLMKNDPVVESVSRSSLSKGSVNECPLSTQNLAAGIAVGVGSYDKLENRTSERELMASVSQFPASIASQNPAAEKSKKEETTKQVNAVPRMGVAVIDSSNNSSDKYFEKVGTVTSPNKAVYNTSQGITGESISGTLACEKTDKIEEQLRSYEDVKFPAAEVISNGFSHSKALDCKTHKKFKKHLRYQFVGLRMGSNIFLQGSLRPRKKHKKMKNCRLVSKGLDKQLNKDHFASDLGPSTSETVKPLPPLSKRKGSKSSSKRRVDGISSRSAMTSNGDLTMSAMSGGFRERKTQAAAVLATDQLSEKSISSEAAANLGGKSRDIENLKDSKADTMQNGLMSMLTRGLEETLVAHWDGIEFSPPPTTESNGAQNGTLGYVLDEWDEEYDRGKRKKVRQSRLDFGGPNYFQEFASQKIKLKKAKLESARSGNLPFRI